MIDTTHETSKVLPFFDRNSGFCVDNFLPFLEERNRHMTVATSREYQNIRKITVVETATAETHVTLRHGDVEDVGADEAFQF
ncbi:MAG: hypothetical protein AAGM67_21770, partial [Bacteroidota bacterium]